MTSKEIKQLDIREITKLILELKMIKPQTQQSKLSIQKLQQRLSKLTLNTNDS